MTQFEVRRHRMYRASRFLLVAALLGMLVVGAGCTGGGTSGGTTRGTSSPNTITLQNIQFDPSTLTVKTGAVVTIENKDSVTHHIVIGTDDLGEQAPGQSKTWTAPSDSVYIMKCLIHPSMSAQITVGSGGSTIGSAPVGAPGTTPY